MDIKFLLQSYLDFLKEEGYVAKVVDYEGNNYISIKYEGDEYRLFIEKDPIEKDIFYFRLLLIANWHCESNDLLLKAYKEASIINMFLKVGKISIYENAIAFITDIILDQASDGKKYIKNMLVIIKEAILSFKERTELSPKSGK